MESVMLKSGRPEFQSFEGHAGPRLENDVNSPFEILPRAAALLGSIALPLLLLLQGCASQPDCRQEGNPTAAGVRVVAVAQIRVTLPGAAHSHIAGAGWDKYRRLHVLAVANECDVKGRFEFSLFGGASLEELSSKPANRVTGWLDSDLPWGILWCEAGFFYSTWEGIRIGTDGSVSDWTEAFDSDSWTPGDELLAAAFSPEGSLALMRGPGITQDQEGAAVTLEVFKAGSNKPSKTVKIEHVRYGAITVTTQRTRGRLVFNGDSLFAFLPGGTIWAGRLDGTIREVVSREDYSSSTAVGNPTMHGWVTAAAIGDGAFGVGRCGAWYVTNTTESYFPIHSLANSELLAPSVPVQPKNTVCFIEELGVRNEVSLFLLNVESGSYCRTLLSHHADPASLKGSFRYLSAPIVLTGSSRHEPLLIGADGTVYQMQRE